MSILILREAPERTDLNSKLCCLSTHVYLRSCRTSPCFIGDFSGVLLFWWQWCNFRREGEGGGNLLILNAGITAVGGVGKGGALLANQ